MGTEKFIKKTELEKQLKTVLEAIPDEYLLVDTATQSLVRVKNGAVAATYPVSTSKYGIGNREGSFKTPLGVHRITEKIGRGAPAGRIFKSRKDTGKDWQKRDNEENMILTRIFRLKGLEPGVNRGGAIDTYDRYIYIHGTNLEDRIGTPTSHGCILMTNNDIIRLFDEIGEGAIVVIR